jgi:predicted transcriptional regulator
MSTSAKATTKTAAVTKLLSRDKGATISEIEKAMGWQPHSCRAFLTGQRKKARIVKEQRSDGKLAYRIKASPSEVAPAE